MLPSPQTTDIQGVIRTIGKTEQAFLGVSSCKIYAITDEFGRSSYVETTSTEQHV
jgi:hypothetical protein